MMIGAKSAMLGCKQAELQALLSWKAKATSVITTQLANLSDFKVEDYMLHGETVKFNVITVQEQVTIMIDAIMTVMGKGVGDGVSGEHLATLGRALEEEASILRGHAAKYIMAIRMLDNRTRMAELINDEMAEWSSKLIGLATTAGAQGMVPPEHRRPPAGARTGLR